MPQRGRFIDDDPQDYPPPQGEYLAERTAIQKELGALRPASEEGQRFEALTAALRSVKLAWDVAGEEERNHLIRSLFEDIRVEGDRVIGVSAKVAFAPFFQLNDDYWKTKDPADMQQGQPKMLQGRKRRTLLPRVPTRRASPDGPRHLADHGQLYAPGASPASTENFTRGLAADSCRIRHEEPTPVGCGVECQS